MRKGRLGKTEYSTEIPGSDQNHNISVRFDLTDGCLGITQVKQIEVERILLSPRQVRALILFLGAKP